MISNSNEIIFDLPVSRLAKLVYLYLCFIADEEGKCIISLSDIAKKCDIKARKTVIGFINELKEVRIIKVDNRTNDTGYTLSNLYTVYAKPYT